MGHLAPRSARLRVLALWSVLACQSNASNGGGLGREGAVVPRPTPEMSAAPLASGVTAAAGAGAAGGARLPLVPIADVELPGGATRFDYQEIDASAGRLVIAHMNDDAVLFVKLSDGSVLKRLTGISVPRGVAVASDVGLVFVTSSPRSLVLIDGKTLTEVRRVQTGKGPDGVAWDPTDKIVGVSDQRDGALSLISDAGAGPRRTVQLGRETGNVVFDGARGWFWITVVSGESAARLVAVQPSSAQIVSSIDLPGCRGAHGLRIHPEGRAAFVACESNDRLLQVDLASSQVSATLATGGGPDVLSIDPALGWLYVASESGDLRVFDIRGPVVTPLGRDQPGKDAHSVAVDAASHRVFFPLKAGPKGSPVLRILQPTLAASP